MYCVNCGKELNEGSRFCPGCGTPVKSGAATSGTPAATYETLQPGTPETVPSGTRETPVCTPETPTVNIKKPDRPAGRKKLILLIVCIVAAVALVAAAGVLVYLNTGPRLTDRLLSRGETCLSEKSYKEAADAFIKVIEKDPKNADAYLGLANAYIGLDDTDGAIEALDAGLTETNGDKQLENKLENINDARVEDWMDEAEERIDDGEYKAAIRLLEQAVSLRPADTDAVLALAGAYRLADRPDDMEDAVLAGIESVPDAEELYLYLADYYMENEDFASAADLLQAGYDATGSGAIRDEIDTLEAASEPAEESEPVISVSTTPEIGLYDPGFDYYSNPRYTFVYMYAYQNAYFDMMDMSFMMWAGRANVEYSAFCSDNNGDLFLTTIQTYAAQGVDGFLFDADSVLYPAINDLMNELGLPWMSCVAEPLDSFGNRCHPFVSYDNFRLGADMAEYAISYAGQTWPDAAPGEVGMLSMDLSLSLQLHERSEGSEAVFLANGYPAENFFVADGANTDDLISIETGTALAGGVFAANPQIEYWLVCSIVDEYSAGAAIAAEQAGIDANCVVTNFGGSALISQWDTGVESCWKSSIFCTQTQYTEPMFFALYAFVNGDATPETIWPDWIDTSGGDRYAYRLAPTFIIEKDNYKEYVEWVDAYSGINTFPYDTEYHGTQFSVNPTPGF